MCAFQCVCIFFLVFVQSFNNTMKCLSCKTILGISFCLLLQLHIEIVTARFFGHLGHNLQNLQMFVVKIHKKYLQVCMHASKHIAIVKCHGKQIIYHTKCLICKPQAQNVCACMLYCFSVLFCMRVYVRWYMYICISMYVYMFVFHMIVTNACLRAYLCIIMCLFCVYKHFTVCTSENVGGGTCEDV